MHYHAHLDISVKRFVGPILAGIGFVTSNESDVGVAVLHNTTTPPELFASNPPPMPPHRAGPVGYRMGESVSDPDSFGGVIDTSATRCGVRRRKGLSPETRRISRVTPPSRDSPLGMGRRGLRRKRLFLPIPLGLATDEVPRVPPSGGAIATPRREDAGRGGRFDHRSDRLKPKRPTCCPPDWLLRSRDTYGAVGSGTCTARSPATNDAASSSSSCSS